MQEGIVFANIDFKDIGMTRREWTFLRDRRPEVYWEIAGLSRQRERKGAGEALRPRERKGTSRKSKAR
jgi:hypothetical protein